MAEPKKTETETIVKTEPVFKNRTKIDQVVYDKSNSAVTVRPGKTVIGECFRKYTGKRNSPLIQTEDPDIKEENIPADQKDVQTNKDGFPDGDENIPADQNNALTDKNNLLDGKGNSPYSKDDTKGKVAKKDDKNKRGVDSKSKK